jgi:hypothetical protein
MGGRSGRERQMDMAVVEEGEGERRRVVERVVEGERRMEGSRSGVRGGEGGGRAASETGQRLSKRERRKKKKKCTRLSRSRRTRLFEELVMEFLFERHAVRLNFRSKFKHRFDKFVARVPRGKQHEDSRPRKS